MLIWATLPLVACGQGMDRPVSVWFIAVLFWNVTMTVFAVNVLLVAAITAGVAVGVAVAVAVAVGLGVAVGAAPGITKNTQSWPTSPPVLFWSPSCTMK